MPHPRHDSPTIDRFLVSVFYHEARRQKQPMTVVTNGLLEKALCDSDSWHLAKSATLLKEEPLPFKP